MKAIKCPDCGSTNTEYGEYALVVYRLTTLDDSAESAADYNSILWDECKQDHPDGVEKEHFMCNECFATVQCASPSADNWKAVEINNDREEVSNA